MESRQPDPELVKLFDGYPVVVTTLVAWGDMDANQHVNNAVYFRYFEHARLRYFEEVGFLKGHIETGVGPILAWTDCRFRRPLTYPDTVSIGTRITDVEADRFAMYTIVVSHAQKLVAAEGQQRIVVFDYHNNRKATLPEALRARIAEFESRSEA